MRLYPENALAQLEFDKVLNLLEHQAATEMGRQFCRNTRVHTDIRYIEQSLNESDEYKQILQSGFLLPNDLTVSLTRELKLLSVPGATLSGEQFLKIRKLSDNAEAIFRWFDAERRSLYPALASHLDALYFEKNIRELMDHVLDEQGQVKDNASEELAQIRQSLYRKRNELRRVFDRIVSRMNKQGYLADIGESFMNGRRVLAVFAEQKRQVKGILHAESDSRRTSFIEPEETTELNNQVFSLEYEEEREVNRILRELTGHLSVYSDILNRYYHINGLYDAIRARARLGIEMHAEKPRLTNRAHVELRDARHPLLYLYHKASAKPTVPVSVTLGDQERILVISGPNAGGKTVSMKTVGLIQLMVQSGMLVPVQADSVLGVFRQLMIHIGDTQSLEFELSTYSSHLRHMKHFLEHANGKSLFFIDELGSGSDPNLGGAFAEVILEELARKHAVGIVTTHYLNLKVMAQEVPGIINGAMQFDESALKPLYKLQVGQPGSSYTFSIAERIGLPVNLINRARKLAEGTHVKLDKLLNATEQDLRAMEKERSALQRLIRENEELQKEMKRKTDQELHRQEIERLKLQNQVAKEQWEYLKEMERKLKAMILAWRKTENKAEVITMIQALLFKQKDTIRSEQKRKKFDERYEELKDELKPGIMVRMKTNGRIGILKSLKARMAVVQLGNIPLTVSSADLVAVKEKTNPAQKE